MKSRVCNEGGNIGKGIMAIAEKEQVCTDIVTMPESQMLEAEEEWGKVCEENNALMHTGVWGTSVSKSKHRRHAVVPRGQSRVNVRVWGNAGI